MCGDTPPPRNRVCGVLTLRVVHPEPLVIHHLQFLGFPTLALVPMEVSAPISLILCISLAVSPVPGKTMYPVISFLLWI